MDQRRAPRLVADQSINVTVLSGAGGRHTARVKNASSRGLGIEMAGPVSPGAAVEIELEDGILLGTVVHCGGEAGCYLVGVELEQILTGLAELSGRLSEFVPDSSGREVTYAVKHRTG